MLAVTRLEKWRVLKARNNVVELFEGFRLRAGVYEMRPHTTAQGWKYCKESRLPKSMFDEDLLQLQRTTLST